MSSQARDAKESTFFKEAPWSMVDSEKGGIKYLRNHLQEILKQHIRREFPKVREELTKLIKERRHQLESLGHSRATPMDQTRYLLELASSFQNLTSKALATDYGASDIFEEHPSLKITTLVHTRDERLAEQVAALGHLTDFEPLPSSTNPSASTTDPDLEHRSSAEPVNRRVREVADHPDVVDILLDQDIEVREQDPYYKSMQWLKDLHNSSRGFELGTFQASILPNAMKVQSSNWEPLALGYVSDIICIVHNFVVLLLEGLCPEENVREALLSVMLDGLAKSYNQSLQFVHLILSVERTETPATLDKAFAMELHQSRQNRKGVTSVEQADGTDLKKMSPEELEAKLKHLMITNQEHTVREIHDILQAYYGIARKRFVDLVCNYAVGHHLVKGERTALKLFDTKFVAALTEDQLQKIAGEDASVKRKRGDLLKELEDLEAGKKILR